MYLRKIFGIFLISLINASLYANWNEDYDATSSSLIEQIAQMQTESYLQESENFTKIRKSLFRDFSLKKELKNSSNNDKFEITRKIEGVILKKRRENNIKEAYVWEVSQFAGSSEFIVPSFAMDMGGKKVVVQKLETFTYGDKKTKCPSSKLVQKVSLKTYWKAHLQAYLFGFTDLVGGNIGVNESGVIRFFDNESSFNYSNTPSRSVIGANVGFISQAFDWPQYKQPLDRNTAEALKAFVLSLSDFEENLQIYLSNRLIQIDEEGLLYRLEKIRSFPLEEGSSFFDFYSYISPRLALGLDELSNIVNPIIKRNGGHGSALFFMAASKERYKLSRKQKKMIASWLDMYME